MATHKTMDIGLLRQLLAYDPDTGSLTWLERARDVVPDDRVRNSFNRQFAGKEALASTDSHGYRHGGIFKRVYKAHRVAWAIKYGEWPDHVDHINGVRSDNRISNLRSVTRIENQKNIAIPSNNTSGVIGVCWVKRNQRWAAQIVVERRHINLGYFAAFEDAVAARKAAELRYGFHPNHGRDAA